MGLYDRDYYRSGYKPAEGGGFLATLTPVVKWLLFLNIGVFLLEFVGENFLHLDFFSTRFELLPNGDRIIYYSEFHKVFAIYEPYLKKYFLFTQYVTYQFLHGGLTHILFNMLGVYMFGRYLERQMGSFSFLKLYLLGGIFAGICHLLFLGRGNVPMIGASGSLCAVLAVFALLNPETELIVFLGFIPVKMRAKMLVWLYAGISLLLLMKGGGNVAHLAHLGGLLFGFLYVRNFLGLRRLVGPVDGALPRTGTFFSRARKQARVFRGQEWEEAEFRETGSGSAAPAEDDPRLAEILERMRRYGMHTLSQEDWEYIQKKRRS